MRLSGVDGAQSGKHGILRQDFLQLHVQIAATQGTDNPEIQAVPIANDRIAGICTQCRRRRRGRAQGMSSIHPGRYTSSVDGAFVVFLIGFRINRLRAIRRWLPVAKAMGPMLRELSANPSLGFLSARASVYWRGAMLVQYWRSFDHLIAYAQARDAAHLPAWKAFNQSVGADGSVGIWHETYQVAAGRYEAIYANMPRYGLADVGTHEPAVGRRHDARSRMKAVMPDP